jgi:hypothetical protein
MTASGFGIEILVPIQRETAIEFYTAEPANEGAAVNWSTR